METEQPGFALASHFLKVGKGMVDHLGAANKNAPSSAIWTVTRFRRRYLLGADRVCSPEIRGCQDADLRAV